MDSSDVKLALLDMGGTINGILEPDSVTMTSRVGNCRSTIAAVVPLGGKISGRKCQAPWC